MFIVTGGAGFIGSNVVAAIEDRLDAPVVVADHLRQGGKWRNLAKRGLADLVAPDALPERLAAQRTGIRAIIHMGAVTSTTETDADRMVEINFRLSARLWSWCAAAQVPFIYASSAATYGDGQAGFDDVATAEGLARFRPLNLYGWSKHLFDRWVVRQVADRAPRPPQWAGLKFFNVYGPNEYHKGAQGSVVQRLFPEAKAGRAARLFTSHHPDYPDGGQMRDFVWVEDCVDVVLWLLDHPDVSGLFNVGSGRARSFADLAAAVYRAAGREPQITYVPMPEAIRLQYQYFTEARLDRLRAAGYDRPATALEDGVSRYVRDYLDTPDPYR
ncbi:MAG: ADP-glyceromanno-heptose 6-epimerase [Rhodospirillales bacterium]|nr:MAG: ADP-glyceromanno-heptose 6-epimerase [Rhodospirillales bacterium]